MNAKKKDIIQIDQTHSGILRLILDDPKNKNALSEKMMHELQQRIFEASSNGSVKVIIIAAVGDVFCVGHNLKDITEARANSDRSEEHTSELQSR